MRAHAARQTTPSFDQPGEGVGLAREGSLPAEEEASGAVRRLSAKNASAPTAWAADPGPARAAMRTPSAAGGLFNRREILRRSAQRCACAPRLSLGIPCGGTHHKNCSCGNSGRYLAHLVLHELNACRLLRRHSVF